MKVIGKIVSITVRIILLLLAFYCAINAVLFILAAFLNFQPSAGSEFSGFSMNSRYKHGIAIPVEMNTILPDSSIKNVVSNGQASRSKFKDVIQIFPELAVRDSNFERLEKTYRPQDTIIMKAPNVHFYGDTIVTEYSSDQDFEQK